IALDIHPYALMIAAAIAASCAFMLPVATPPNAVVFGSGYLRIPDMVKVGFALNIIGILLTTMAINFLLPFVLDIDFHEVPEMFKNVQIGRASCRERLKNMVSAIISKHNQ